MACSRGMTGCSGSELRTSQVTLHRLTNAEVIRVFLPVEIGVDGSVGGPVTVQVRPGPAEPIGLNRRAVDLRGAETMTKLSEKDADMEEEPFLRVACYAGHRGDSEPRRLHIGRREVAVTEIIDRWLDPRHRYFKLRGDDGGIYLLRQDTIENRSEMTLYDSGRRDETRLTST